MDRDTRNAIERATQRARALLAGDFESQLESTFDVLRSGKITRTGGAHLSAREEFQREKIVAAIEHKQAVGMSAANAVADYIRDAAFTTLNRFVALKMLEARELVLECISKGEQSSGYREFCGLAPGVALLPDSAGYRLYIESLFDELSTEVKVLFDRRDSASVLWPKRATIEALFNVLNAHELKEVWTDDETIGWFYQFYNSREERQAMRDPKQGGSQAPRNSRELAVRNQFFTPRYVVEFLVDNTLGRIWYEMQDGKTQLAERCEYLVRQPNETWAPRPNKDPRDLNILDPACGSGHFLLYCFDLFLVIYEEAWADADAPQSEATGGSLKGDYPEIGDLRASLPGLILRYNLHGIDIDSRCAQIAQLALWMRAQRAFRDFGIARAERPVIRRTNIVIAEPMPGEKELLNEFLRGLKEDRLEELIRRALGIPPERTVKATKAMADSLAELVAAVWNGMKLVGEMGPLLKIERDLARAIEKGRAEWEDRLPLFRVAEYGLGGVAKETLVRVVPGGQEDFWTKAEKLVFQALDDCGAAGSGAGAGRRRLFADDAVQGFALADVLAKRFDTVLMNPPFGAGSLAAKPSFDKIYPKTKTDLYFAFVERGTELLQQGGRLGAITSRTGFFQPSGQKWREDILLGTAPPVVVADLGFGVLDSAMVETAAYVLEKNYSGPSIWYRLVSEVEKSNFVGKARNIYQIESASLFAKIPTTPFVYWMPSSFLSLFKSSEKFERQGRNVRCGMGTLDDLRFVRNWWEVRAPEAWTPYAKGGDLTPFVTDMPAIVNFRERGREVKLFVEMRVGSASRKVQAESFYFRKGLQYGRRIRNPSPAILPAGCIFSDNANGIFIDGDRDEDLYAYLGLLNSDAAKAILTSIAPIRKMEVGYLKKMPIPSASAADVELVSASKAAARIAISQLCVREASRYFTHPWASIASGGKANRFDCLGDKAFGIPGGDIEILKQQSEILKSSTNCEEDGDEDAEHELDADQVSERDKLLSWAVGVAFNRFDIRLATGERPMPPEAEPFDPLPPKSPGMVPDGDQPFVPCHGILVDDMGHNDDLVHRVNTVYERLGKTAPDAGVLRRALARDFFATHSKMYSKSRRKTPIYWQLATPSASYSVWLYIHAFSNDTLFRVQNDYVAPKLSHEQRKLEGLRAEAGPNPSSAERKAIAAQEKFVEELQAFLDEVKRVAPLWNPDLDDGVIINFAQLWRLVPQHKPWQKELNATWDALCAGSYDWAHLAMHLWPERVVPKCATDHSFAIAHGLEDALWFGDADGKWKPYEAPARRIDELVRERSSPAVKAALQSFLDAPEPAGGLRRSRNGGG